MSAESHIKILSGEVTPEGLIEIIFEEKNIIVGNVLIKTLSQYNTNKHTDISYILGTTEYEEKEDQIREGRFLISPKDLDENCICGVYTIILKEKVYERDYLDEPEEEDSIEIVSLDCYLVCLMNILLSTEYDECHPIIDSCHDCSEDVTAGLVVYTLLVKMVELGHYDEAARLEERLKILCEDCHPCDTIQLKQLWYS